ncbi:MAG: acyl-CoA dehydrogenase [Planctomycetota bacterium]
MIWSLFATLLILLGLAFAGPPLWALVAAASVAVGVLASPWWGLPLAIAAVVLALPPLRVPLLSRPVMRFLRRANLLPQISDTERAALEAGTVWVEGELFSGRPDAKRLLAAGYPDLSERERAFLDGPVAQLCAMTTEWEILQRRDLPEAVWAFLKRERFFGLIIPEEYGGLGFSASANSAIVGKVSSVSIPLGITVMVPNSLGPAELLVHYGTQAQKNHYLPRLARGEDVPAFALTEPGAGSDAGAIEADGVVFRGDDGKLWLRLNWRKRYITLAAVATVLGLAFKLRDPEGLLGRELGQDTDLGITCALVPTDAAGVVLGMRHDPLGLPFYNCPTEGHDVVVPIDAIIGGPDGAGRGWQMLMESLAAGRGISLPATSASGCKKAARVAGAYVMVRQQFGLPLGRFEGVQEVLGRIGGFAYVVEAARRYTCGALDTGAKPAVVTAMMKLHTTELCRRAVNDAMDLLGGAAISRGPRNTLAIAYTSMPISITVEGANILTRTLMIFGQGAIRCHPYALAEIEALGRGDVRGFDRALWAHVAHVVRNGARALVLSLSRGLLAASPVPGPAAGYWRKLQWASASFAFWADVAMGSLGGDLKRREMLAGRYSDVFSALYLATATLRRFEAEGGREEDAPFLRWSMDWLFARMQEGLDGLFANLSVPGLTWLLRGPVAWWSRLNPFGGGPSDADTRLVARLLQMPGAQRDRVTSGLYQPPADQLGVGQLERAMHLVAAAEPAVDKVKAAVRAGKLPRSDPPALDRALAEGVLTAAEVEAIRAADAARRAVVEVDAFSLADYATNR